MTRQNGEQECNRYSPHDADGVANHIAGVAASLG